MIHSLHVAQSGLTASKTSVENVMNNIANENTPGYKKRVVDLAESSHVDSREYGRGVSVGETVRITNQYMYDNLIKEEGKDAYYSELDTMLSDIESIFYETDVSGLSSDLDSYFQAIEDLRANPYDAIAQNNFENQARIIVDDLKNLYQGIEDRETVARNTLDDDVATVNDILHDIGSVNEQIMQQLTPSNDLLDKRDQLEKELAEHINIDVDRTLDYELKIGGLTAVRYNTNIHTLQIVNDYKPQTDKYVDSSYNSTIGGPNGFDNAGDQISFVYNNTYSIDVTYGSQLSNGATYADVYGPDYTGPETPTDPFIVDEDNYVVALSYEINHHQDLPSHIVAKNGKYSFDTNDNNRQYTLDQEGNKVYAPVPTENEYLVVESVIPGEDGRFEGRIVVNDVNGGAKSEVIENENWSLIGSDDTHIEIFDEEVSLIRGGTRAIAENLQTDNTYNRFTQFRDSLDAFANALSDMSHTYLEGTDGSYIYGRKASELNTDNSYITHEIKLFSGSSVESLEFHASAARNLSQADLDYLATFQWKDDIGFDGAAQDGMASDGTSFSKFYQTLLVNVSAAKESNDFAMETQSAVTMSLSSTYDKMVKVDKDEEMLNLIKFQAAYEANAKIITVVDEMLQTILGMR